MKSERAALIVFLLFMLVSPGLGRGQEEQPDKYPSWFQEARRQAQEVWKEVKQTTQEMWNTARREASEWWKKAVKTAPELWKEAKQQVQKLWKKILQKAQDYMDTGGNKAEKEET
jgi:F0F1-type ATP synthase membrane subunit b/b'